MPYVVFGAGKYAERVASEMILRGFSIECVVDNDREKWGSFLLGLSIKSPAALTDWHDKKIIVIIAVVDAVFYREIANQLSKMAMIEEINFFSAEKMFHLSGVPNGWVSGYIGLPDDFDSIKTFDNQSRLIVKKDEKKIFRAVTQKYAEQYKAVLECCQKHGLFENYVVNTKIAERDGNLPFDFVLEHEFIEPVSYCFEWPPKTFKAYVLFMIRFIKALDKATLGLKDGHALNATFYKGRFVFLDFGAMTPGKTSYATMMEFINTHIIPLLLLCKNQIQKAYLFLKNAGLEYTLADIVGYLSNEEIEQYKELTSTCLKIISNGKVAEFCDCLLDYCGSLSFDLLSSKWNGYQDEEWGNLNEHEIWTEKQKNPVELVKTVHPKTLIDLAGNMGWYGAALSGEVDYSIIADFDYSSIDSLYEKIADKASKISNIVPVYLNIVAPTPDYYRDDAIGNTGIIPWRKSAIERFRCEMAMAISIVHHLAFSQQLTFREIVHQIRLFTSRYLIVEFIKKEDEYIKDFLKAGFDWYTEEAFIQALETEFTILTTKPSTPSITRTLYLCEVKSQLK